MARALQISRQCWRKAELSTRYSDVSETGEVGLVVMAVKIYDELDKIRNDKEKGMNFN